MKNKLEKKPAKDLNVIEFYGLPGVGKSSITNQFKNRRDPNIITYSELIEKQYSNLPSRFYFVIRLLVTPKYHYIFIVFCALLIKSNCFTLNRILRFKNLMKYAILYKSKNIQSKFLIVDQGIIQEINSIFLHKDINHINHLEKLIKYLDLDVKRHFFVNLNYDIDVTLSRYESRGYHLSSMQSYDNITLKEKFMKIDRNISIIEKSFRNQNFRIFSIKNNDLSSSVERVKSIINNIDL